MRSIQTMGPSFTEPQSGSDEFGERLARRVFAVLHGFYGNQWMDKFRSGQVDAAGSDTGVLAAQKVWAAELARCDVDDVKRALERVKTDCQRYAPSLPEFMACVRAVQRHVTKLPPAGKKSAMPAGVRASIDQLLRQRAPVTQRPTSGLPVVLSLVAQAVGLAGGDESSTLLWLEDAYR